MPADVVEEVDRGNGLELMMGGGETAAGFGPLLERTVSIGDSISDVLGGSMGKSGMGSIVEEEGEGEGEAEAEAEGQAPEYEEDGGDVPDLGSRMYLASGLGVDKVTCGDLFTPNFENEEEMEQHYQSMIKEFPSHSLLLRNYAEFLKDKGDVNRAKDYYHMATMADPGDGDILSHYAQLVWELDADREQADQCFERAVHLAPLDSHVHAAYANFLWKTEEGPSWADGAKDCSSNEEESCEANTFSFDSAPQMPVAEMVHQEEGMGGGGGGGGTSGNGGSNLGTSSAGSSGGGGSSMEDHYKRMVQENPSNPMILRNYAHFLYQSKGDLQGAEEYYARAILLDKSDGELLSQYAGLVWELHGDKEKALAYFQRAAQIAPGDSHVLAAYASFLWTSGCEEDDDAATDYNNNNEEEEEAEAGIQLPPCVHFPVSLGILAAPRHY